MSNIKELALLEKELNHSYQTNGEFTHQQKINHFTKPNQDILDMISCSDDVNFRKTCLMSIMDYNTTDTMSNYKDFLKQDIIKETLNKLYSNNNE